MTLKTAFALWNIVVIVAFILLYKYSHVAPVLFVVNLLALLALRMWSNFRVDCEIKRHEVDKTHLGEQPIYTDHNKRYIQSNIPEVQEKIDERNTLTPYAIINIIILVIILALKS